MKISYNWLKWYIPQAPEAEKLADIFTYHVAEVEEIEKMGDDFIFEIKILPNRAHDLLSHQGVAREIASLLNIKYVDPTEKFKIPESQKTDLKIEIKTDACKRYMGRVVRNIKVGPSPDWVVKFLEAVGQRSINNIVDATNLVLLDCGNPIHVFDLDKMNEKIIIRNAKDGEQIITLDNKIINLKNTHIVIEDGGKLLEIGGLKGGENAEVDVNTKNIILEVSSFMPTPIRKMSVDLGFRTEGSKRHENDFSPELGAYAMRELSATILEMCPEAIFEDIVDARPTESFGQVYPQKPEVKKLSFSVKRISSILGLSVSIDEVKNILDKYLFEYKNDGDVFHITVPTMRLDLENEEDMAEEIGRVLGYDKIKGEIPKINFTPKVNEIHNKIVWARNKLLARGYSEVMTYVFTNKGEVEVMASASDKKFLRTNLSDGLKDSFKLNKTNMSLLGVNEIKIFEIGTVFLKGKEEMHVAFADKKETKEMSLEEFFIQNCSLEEHGYFSAEKFLVFAPSSSQVSSEENFHKKFHPWSAFPFITRDIALWVPKNISSDNVIQIIKDNMGKMVVKGPELFDQFQKDGKTSYAFRLIFQSFEKTLTDDEVNEIMNKITDKIKENLGWQVR